MSCVQLEYCLSRSGLRRPSSPSSPTLTTSSISYNPVVNDDGVQLHKQVKKKKTDKEELEQYAYHGTRGYASPPFKSSNVVGRS